MKNLRFSLSALFLLSGVVFALVVVATEMAPERALVAVWAGAAVLSYVKFCNVLDRAWKKILATALVTTLVWLICISCTYLMYISKQELDELLRRAATLVLIGSALTLPVAVLLSAFEFGLRAWLKAGSRRRLVVIVGIALSAFV